MPTSPTRTMSLPTLLGVTAPEISVSDLTLDSRAVAPGALFVALAGNKQHGLDFAPQAIANGARAIAYDPLPGFAPLATPGVAWIAMPNLRAQLGAIADRFFDSPSAHMKVVGVTGTNGKTTTAYLIPSALSKLQRASGYAGTLGCGHVDALRESAHTTADCITVHRQLATMREAGDSYVGIEVSSHALDQGRIDGVRVHTALFTNLTRDHLDYHGSFAAYGAAKEKLFQREELKHVVINAGDAFGRELLARSMRKTRSVTAYGAEHISKLGDRQLFATRVEPAASGLRISFDGSFGRGVLDTKLVGAFNVENALGTLAALLGLDVPLADALWALSQCDAPPGRMETLIAENKPLIVIDYAHTPDALCKALQTARQHTRGRLICVFGCGGDRDAGKRPLMGEIAEREADAVVLTDDNPRMEDPDAIIADILQGFTQPQKALVERDRARAIARAVAMAKPADLVLVAGKGHENYQIVGRNVKAFSDREVAQHCLGQKPC